MPTVAFTPEHVEAAAQLLARRHADNRRSEPLLDPAYESPEVCATDIEALLRTPDASGAIVLEREGPVAFMLGAPRDPRR